VAATAIVCAASVAAAAAQTPVRDVYYTYCGLEDKPAKCELRSMTENLADSKPVSTLPAWFSDCGPGNDHPSTTISADGTTAVTLEDTSKAPGNDANTPICRLVVTNLGTGESRVLPPYPPGMMASIEASGWTVSPNGRYITIHAASGVYVQDIQAATPPRLLRTGFSAGGVGWYPDSSRLLVDGPSPPLGGRGPVDTANRLFEFTITGQLLGSWLIKPYPAYLFGASFIQISSTGQVFAGAGASYLSRYGGKPTMPSGYYLLRLQKDSSAQLVARVSRTGYTGTIGSFGADAESGLVFIAGGENQVCSVSISRGTRRCVRLPGSPATVTVSGVQLALALF
jgi:hypothetical protein